MAENLYFFTKTDFFKNVSELIFITFIGMYMAFHTITYQ
jgi:hypothetical protein